MRKIYAILLAVMLLPVFAVAQNKAIQKTAPSYYWYAYEDSRILVPFEAAGFDSTQEVEQTADPQNYSVGMWFNTTGVSNSNPKTGILFRMGTGSHNNNNGASQLLINSSGALTLTFRADNGFGQGDFSVGTAPLNQWNHVLLVFDSANGNVRVYVNGEETLNDTSIPGFGYKWGDGVFQFYGMCYSGLFDEVQLFNKALSAAEAQAAYANAYKVDGLSSLYTFDAVKEGTLSTFESVAGSITGHDAIYQWCRYDAYYAEGLAGINSQAETTVALRDGREIAYTDPVEFYLLGDIFEEGRVELTATATVDETEVTYASQAEAHMIVPGTILTLNAVPAEGYTMAGYVETLDGVERYFTDPVYGFSMAKVGASVAAYAVTDAAMWNMTVVNEANLTYTITDPWNRNVTENLTGLYGAGDAVEYKLVLGSIPYEYDAATLEVKLGEEVLTAENGAYAIASAENATLTISIQAKPKYTVTIEQPEHGTISAYLGTEELVSGAEVVSGSAITFDNTPEAGHRLVNYLVNGNATTEATLIVTENVTVSARFEEGIEYCVPAHISGDNYTRETDRHAERYLTAINLNDGASQLTIEVGGRAGGPNTIWNDFTGTYTYVTNPGSTVTVKSTGGGVWMNTFVYADFNNNGFDTGDKLWDNFGGAGNAIATEFTIAVPENTPFGTYRVRYIVDWNNEDGPCYWGQSSNPGTQYGECVVDFLIQIESSDLAEARTVTVASVNDAYGTVAITDPATSESSISTVQKTVTIEATAAEGYTFINWTDANGNVVSTDATYTYTGETDASFVANFGVTVTYTVGEGGTATFMADGNPVGSGDVLVPGTEVTVTASPETGKTAQVVVNGATVALTENVCTFEANEATNVAVNFLDAVYTMEIVVVGVGEVKVSEGGNKASGPTGNEYVSGSDITGKSLKVWAKPAEGGSLISIINAEEGAEDKVLTTQAVTAAGWEGWYLANVSRPSANRTLTVTFTGTSGIDEIGIDPANGPVEYYNLQGVRVAAENLVPGFYVIRQGEKAAKVFINK